MPIRYNDGQQIEQEKFLLTAEDLVRQFGAVTYQPELLRGIWTHEGHRYEDENVRLFVDVHDSGENAVFFREFKELLKSRFRQIDIWIVSFEIRVT